MEKSGALVRAMFDRVAPRYDLVNRAMSAGIDRRWRSRAVRELDEGPQGPLLDLCAGTMDLTALLARTFPGRRLVAADFSEKMLDRGRSKAPGAEVRVADAHALPFADGEFAGVICGFGARNLADLARAVREVKRVLRPGGVFVTLEFFRPTRAGASLFHATYGTRLIPAIGGLLSGERDAYTYLASSIGSFLSRREYERLLEEAGFVRVRGFDLTLGVASVVTAEVAG
jgi:ubiquinone/menaquinone biosynthesis methyltransferase